MNIIAFGGPYDMILIFLAILILFGSKKLPDLAKGMGQAIREFNKAKDEIEREITKPANEVAVHPAVDKLEHNPAAASTTAPTTPTAPTPPTTPTV